MLSCSCGYDDFEWWYHPPDNFSQFSRKRRKRCVSCHELINAGADCLAFDCYREPYNDIEEQICGDEVQIADKFLCEKCGEIFLNLESLGYCMSLGHNLKDDLEEYWDLTGFEPKEKP